MDLGHFPMVVLTGALNLPDSLLGGPSENPRWPNPPQITRAQSKYIDAAVKAANMKPVMKTLHLVTAVMAVIGQFHKTQATFSAHDVTRTLRENLAAGQFDLADVPDRAYFGNAYLPVVKHDSVREIVKEVFDQQLVPDYTGENFSNPGTNTSYVRYVYGNASTVAQSNPVASATPTQANNPTNTFIPAAPVGAKVAAPLKNMDQTAWEKAEAYVRNQVGIGFSPSLKAVQSRLKGYSVTCKQLAAYFGASRDFAVNPEQNVSESTVVLS